MMIRKQEKKLTEVLMKKTHFSFGEIGTAPTFQPMRGDQITGVVQSYTWFNSYLCGYFTHIGVIL